jgi:hypothetical protein
MAGDERPPFAIDLWGGPSVGKTSALAAYFGSAKPRWVDDQDAMTKEKTGPLLEKWIRFDRGQLPTGTATSAVHSMRHKSGRMIAFRDMRGGGVLDSDPIDYQSLCSADASIVFVEWPRRGDVTPVALKAPLVAAKNDRSVLVLTKVEMHLRLEEIGLFLYDPIKEARRHRFPALLVRAMEEQFAGRVFPVSIYGYGEDGLPASYMDEFGRQLPRGVSPVNIEMPFEYVLRGLE